MGKSPFFVTVGKNRKNFLMRWRARGDFFFIFAIATHFSLSLSADGNRNSSKSIKFIALWYY
jgi:hypothetical protein